MTVTLGRSPEELGVTRWSSGSWLNMVMILFGTITRQAIRRGSFTNLIDTILAKADILFVRV